MEFFSLTFAYIAQLSWELRSSLRVFSNQKKINIFFNVEEQNRVIVGFLIIAGFILFIQFVGFYISSAIFIFLMNSYLNKEKMNLKNILISFFQSILITTLAYYLFVDILYVPLPTGILLNT